jgi:branched-chain amino acid aminotransferase
MEYVNYNGKIYPAAEPIVSAASRALRYGDGLFETMKLHNGTIVHMADHFSRLWQGLQALQFQIPPHFTPAFLAQSILLLAKKNACQNNARVRLNIFRAEGGLYDLISPNPSYVIECWPLSDTIGDLNSNGLVAGICNDIAKSCDMLCNIKHNNYLGYIMAAMQAKKNRWNDALILNQHGRVADSTIANVFLIKNNCITTPLLTEGCVAGVMRKNLLKFLKAGNWQVKEVAVTTDDLLQADEVFFTNSIYIIRWVKQIGESNYSNLLTQQIYQAFVPTIC